MGTMNGFFHGQDMLSSNASYHLGQAVSLVNQRLGTAEALSDSSLAVVNFLIVQQLLRESRTQAEIHLRGLQKMIELRGGISQLGQDNALALKICKYVTHTVCRPLTDIDVERTDLDFALHWGTTTCFYRDRMTAVAEALTAQGFFMDSTLVDVKSSSNKINPALRQVLVDATNVACLFNRADTNLKLNPAVYQEIIISIGGRLVGFHPLGDPPLTMKLEAAYHIGLIVFLTTMFIQIGRRRFLKYGLVGQCLKNLIHSGLDEDDNDLLLWLLFIGGISVLGGSEQSWVIVRIRTMTTLMGLGSWTELRNHLGRFPWIGSLHDCAGRALWNAAKSISTLN